MEGWLQERILASKESYLPFNPDSHDERHNRPNLDYKRGKEIELRRERDAKDTKDKRDYWNGALKTEVSKCRLCKEKHRFFKCPKYIAMKSNDRYAAANKYKLCYNCLKRHHFTSKCTSKNNCSEKDCTERHHTTLHGHFIGSRPNDTFNGMISEHKECVYLQIVPVELEAENGSRVSTNALLDTGSQSTLIRSDIAKLLHLKGIKRNLSISTIKDKGESMEVDEVNLTIKSIDGCSSVLVPSAYVIDRNKFNMPSHLLPIYFKMEGRYQYLKDIKLHDIQHDDVGILIGANVPDALVTKETKKGEASQPMAIRTLFGWTLFGGDSGKAYNATSVNLLQVEEENMHELVQEFWKTESQFLESERDNAPCQEDKRCLQTLQECIEFNNGKYVTPILWKTTLSYHTIKKMAARRFMSLEKRLRKDSELLAK